MLKTQGMVHMKSDMGVPRQFCRNPIGSLPLKLPINLTTHWPAVENAIDKKMPICLVR